MPEHPMNLKKRNIILNLIQTCNHKGEALRRPTIEGLQGSLSVHRLWACLRWKAAPVTSWLSDEINTKLFANSNKNLPIIEILLWSSIPHTLSVEAVLQSGISIAESLQQARDCRIPERRSIEPSTLETGEL